MSTPTRDSRAEFRRRRRGKILRALLLAVGSGGLLVVAAWRVIRSVAEAASCSSNAQVLLVPGHRLQLGEIDAVYARRLRRTLALWRDAPTRVLLLSGGGSGDDGPSEAHVALTRLIDLGLPVQAHVLLEPASLDTEENLRLSAALLEEAIDCGRLPATVTVAIVSNRWHLARCAWLAGQLGLPWPVVAAEARRPRGPAAWLAELREALSLLALAGYDAARLDPSRLLRAPR